MSKKLTAAQWITSSDPEAEAWRKEASIEAFNAVIHQITPEAGKTFAIPATPIERPPTQKARYFDVPGTAVDGSARRGKYFDIPGEDPRDERG